MSDHDTPDPAHQKPDSPGQPAVPDPQRPSRSGYGHPPNDAGHTPSQGGGNPLGPDERDPEGQHPNRGKTSR